MMILHQDSEDKVYRALIAVCAYHALINYPAVMSGSAGFRSDRRVRTLDVVAFD